MTLTHIYGKIYNTHFYAPKDLMLHWIDLFPNLVVIREQVVLCMKQDMFSPAVAFIQVPCVIVKIRVILPTWLYR